jgi:hypothetical protein
VLVDPDDGRAATDVNGKELRLTIEDTARTALGIRREDLIDVQGDPSQAMRVKVQ